MRTFRSAVFPLLATAHSVFGALYEDASRLPTTEYDYVIVGGGTAGLVLANRLTEDPKTSVIVLEAGVSHEGVTPVEIPLLCSSLAPNTPYDWNYTTTAQPGFNSRSITYARGFILGGSSSTNYLLYTRGSRDDFDAYAKIAGDDSWSWDAVYNKWSRKNEEFVKPSNASVTTDGRYLPEAHSTTGEVEVSLTSHPTPLDDHVLAAAAELGNEFSFRIDGNTGNPLGISWLQATIGEGKRSSSATAYLAPKYLSRPNLAVLIHARATKVLQNGTVSGLPRFDGVEFATSSSSPVKRVRARKEVILSAGAINSPQLLMLSGIGDRKLLTPLGIKTIVDLPSVGQNSSDHVLVGNTFHVNSNDTLEKYTSAAALPGEIAKWNETHEGPLSFATANHLGWHRLPANDSVLARYGDPTAGPTSPHYEMIFSSGGGAGSDGTPSNSITTALISPTSRGNITLNSTDPFAAPIINPNFLTTELDIHIMVSSVKAARKFVSSNAFKGYFKEFYGAVAKANTDAEIEQYVRNNGGTVWHLVGTAGMTSSEAHYGVVNPDFRVKNTSGLRVVDASVFPFVPSAHTQAPVYFLAELASDKIKTQK